VAHMVTLLVLPTHFLAMVSFALLVSAAFAFLSKQTGTDRVKYVVWAFIKFMLVAIGIGWLLYPFSK
jgi:hypothetical protein